MKVGATIGCSLFLSLFNHVKAVVVALVNPFIELFFPGGLLGLDGCIALGFVSIACKRAACNKPGERLGCGLGVTMNAHRNFFDETKVGVIGLNLNNLRVLRPVIKAMLRQSSEGAHARAKR